ncbi:MAG: ABC transporter ATP-binding protein [Hyphomicrobium sp.]
MTTAAREVLTLSAESIRVSLGGRCVLENFSTRIGGGEFVAVVGANGAGKSTVLKALAGLITPDEGRVRLDGRLLPDIPARELARAVAYLPQDRTVHWALGASRVVALGRLPHRSFAAAESATDQAAIDAAMVRMDVMPFAQRPIVTLSGGERARVLVARALAQEARFLIADEPTAGLDPAHSLHLFEEFSRLACDGNTVITAIHDLSMALRYAHRVILLSGGRCIADGPAAAVLNNDLLAQAFGIETIVTTVGGIPIVLPTSALT